MKDKQALYHLCFSKRCNLSYSARMVYSFLLRKKKVTPSEVCNALRLNLKTVTPALAELEKARAVSYAADFQGKRTVLRYTTLALPDGHLMIGKKSKKPQTYKVRIPTKGAKINPLQNILYWFLCSVLRNNPCRTLKYSYLVTVLNVSKGRIRNSLAQLQAKGMVGLAWEGNTFTVKIPPLGEKEGWYPGLVQRKKKEENKALPEIIEKLPKRCHKLYLDLLKEGLSPGRAGNLTLWTEKKHWNTELLYPYWLTEDIILETIEMAKKHCPGKPWHNYFWKCIVNILKGRDTCKDSTYASIEQLR